MLDINKNFQEKYDKLIAVIKRYGSIAVAFSGGVDSTFLLKAAYDLLGDRAIAVTARSSTYPGREFNEAVEFIKSLGAKHVVIVSEELDIDGFSDNPPNRCYYCKKELFSKIKNVAAEHGIDYIADGSNVDDLSDYRPGMQAAGEIGVVSPLKEAGLTKNEIREISRKLGLPTWDKPAFACLSSRFPYGQKITREKLEMVEKAEQFLLDSGFRQVRVRHHGDIARIEVGMGERVNFFNEGLMDGVYKELKKLGFMYVTLDLKGYRTGSMNEVLPGRG